MTALPPHDRVMEYSTSNSQTVFALTGAVDTSYNAFSAFMIVGDTVIGGVVEEGVAFKSGILTYSAANQITVTTTNETKGTFSASGVKKVCMGQPAARRLTASFGEQITFETGNTSASHGPFVAKASDAGNPALVVGYNIDPVTLNFINASDRAVFFSQETDYNDGTGHNKMEQYWQYQFTAGFGGAGTATYRRTIMTQYDKVTNLPTGLFLSGGPPNGVQVFWNAGTGTEAEQTIGKPKAVFLDTFAGINSTPGSATYALQIDTSAALSATGLNLNCFSAGSGLALSTVSTATNDGLAIDAKGSGIIRIGTVSTGPIIFGTSALSQSPTGGIGYAAGLGAGGTVTQGAGSGKATTVALNKASGEITMNNAALAAGAIVTFGVTNSAIAAADVLVLNQVAGTRGAYSLNAWCQAGSAAIDVRNNTAGSLSEAIVIRYAVIKGAVS